MAKSMMHIVKQLERLSRYDGAWLPMAGEAELLKARVHEIRDREQRLDDLLVIALVGGSGVGKSTLLNALAGDELAQTSEFRPCTASPTVYHPPGARLDFAGDWKRVSGSALEHLVIVDTPDSDTIMHEHRDIVVKVLEQCDLIVMCADAEKYLNEATWSLLRPLQGERAMVCVETKATQQESVREHWLKRLEEEGFATQGYFRVNSLRSFDRKVAGGAPGEDEYDFAELEEFLRTELSKERIRRIKRSNTAGLLSKTIETLSERVGGREAELRALRERVNEADAELAKTSFDVISGKLFGEPHLWTYALGRESSLRAKGIIGTLNRLLESARTIPARIAGMRLWPTRGSTGRQAAQLLSDADLMTENLDVSNESLRQEYVTKQSELGVQFAQAGFGSNDGAEGFDQYTDALGEQVARVLRGPARERIQSRARILTSWPLVILLDVGPLAFFGFTAYNIVQLYLAGDIQDWGFFVHSGSVLGILLAAELFALSLLGRFLAFTARRGAHRDLREGLLTHPTAFTPERAQLDEALRYTQEVQALSGDLATD